MDEIDRPERQCLPDGVGVDKKRQLSEETKEPRYYVESPVTSQTALGSVKTLTQGIKVQSEPSDGYLFRCELVASVPFA